jgi:hypothetical protein
MPDRFAEAACGGWNGLSLAHPETDERRNRKAGSLQMIDPLLTDAQG